MDGLIAEIAGASGAHSMKVGIPNENRRHRWNAVNASPTKSPPKTGAKAKPINVREGEPPSRLIDQRNRNLRGVGDRREQTLARMRALILEADPKMVQERK